MPEVTDREILQELAAKPIGGAEVQKQCDDLALAIANGNAKPTPDMVEASERARKKWLPAGGGIVSRKDQAEREAAFYENQIDLEQAVEAAGGARGRLNAA